MGRWDDFDTFDVSCMPRKLLHSLRSEKGKKKTKCANFILRGAKRRARNRNNILWKHWFANV